MHPDNSPSPYSQDAELSTPNCCKTPLPRCFAAMEYAWLHFHRCELTFPRFQAAMDRCNGYCSGAGLKWSLQHCHGALNLTSGRYIVTMAHCNSTMGHCNSYLTIRAPDMRLFQAAMRNNSCNEQISTWPQHIAKWQCPEAGLQCAIVAL
jgi:hypothetical protein